MLARIPTLCTAGMIHGTDRMKPRTNAATRIPGALVLLWLTLHTALAGQESPFFPLTGPVAMHQRSLDCVHPAVVMLVAPEPGAEDLRLLAYLRSRQGIRTAVAFLTNGEATPGDTLSQYPVWMTGERKMEAHRAGRFLDAAPWFINAPDVAAPGRWLGLERFWDSTGASQRLVEVVRTVQPDVIVLCADPRAPEDRISGRDSMALSFVRRAIAAAAGTRDTSISKGLLPWAVGKVFVHRPAPRVPTVYAAADPVRRVSPTAMAAAAGALYRTLRLRIPERIAAGCTYHDVTDGAMKRTGTPPEKIADGAQDPGPHLQSAAQLLRAAVRTSARGVRSATVSALLPAVSAMEDVILRQKNLLTRRERRVAIAWKEALEDLRCTALGIALLYSATDSVLTANQIFFLNLTPDPASIGRGETIVIFPLAVSGEWTVNEKSGYFFSLDSASQFNILTPAEVRFTVPPSEFGLSQATMGTVFPFVVIHKDPRRELSYMFRREIRLQFGPRRTFTLRTPLVYDAPSTPVIVELQNISRDKFRGDLVLSDTTGEPDHLPVEFTKKDEKIVDTLYLPGEAASQTGGRVLLLELSGRGGKRSVTARAFTALSDSGVRAALLSTVHDSPLAEALRVTGQPQLPGSPDLLAAAPAGTTVLVDRDFLAESAVSAAVRRDLAGWVRRGGHAVIFPQSGNGGAWLNDTFGATFRAIEPLAPDVPVIIPWDGAMRAPNAIAGADWEGWVEARACGEIVSSRQDARIILAAGNGTVPLIVDLPEGKGSVTLVAADLQSQLMNYHPGVYRLVANLIAVRPR